MNKISLSQNFYTGAFMYTPKFINAHCQNLLYKISQIGPILKV